MWKSKRELQKKLDAAFDEIKSLGVVVGNLKKQLSERNNTIREQDHIIKELERCVRKHKNFLGNLQRSVKNFISDEE